MKRVWLLLSLAYSSVLTAGEVAATSVTAQQRYPWNGLVDIVVTIQGNADEMNVVRCIFTATNNATSKAVPVMSVTRVGVDSIAGDVCKRRYLWNAAKDVGAVKIDDLALTVDASVGVQLWENGPYWAECNVGAAHPEEYGYYFWWGDTVGCQRNDSNNGWISVKDGSEFCFTDENCPTHGKSMSELLTEGYVDSTGNIAAAHDAATAHLGAPWRMPTDAEFAALISNCDKTWTMRGGVYGTLVTGRGAYASKSIFLPAAGLGFLSMLNRTGSRGNYWSSAPYSRDPYCVYAWLIFFDSSEFYLKSDDYYGCYNYRSYGQSVRPLWGFAEQASVKISESGVTTHLVLDCRMWMRVPSPDGEVLRYDASWHKNCEEVRITDNGTVVTTGTSGCCSWRPVTDASSPHLLKLEFLSEGRVIGTETAQFALGYIRNATARQLWPHNKVALSFTVAADIGDVKGTNEDLCVWCCSQTVETNVATHILGDRSAKPGVHRVVWDMEAEGLRFANAEATFCVGVEKVISIGGVQLWENGPYWAECNVGASKPSECGYYFWWGDTVGCKRNMDNNGWSLVKDGASYSFTDCPTDGQNNFQLQSSGYIDSTGNLAAIHDAATVHLGSPWRMPTDAEFSSLISNCDTTWTVRDGVCGHLVTGKGRYAPRSIFLPAAGIGGYGSNYYDIGSIGRYWSSTPKSDTSNYAWILYFDGYFCQGLGSRYYGLPVRPLRGFAHTGQGSSADFSVAAVDTTLSDGLVVSGSVDLVYSPIDGGNVSLQINGREVLTATEPGTYVWIPERAGTYVHTHLAGTNVFTRKVIYHGGDDAKELEIGWLDQPVSNRFPNIYASVTNVVLAPSITGIESGAFGGCSLLTGFVIRPSECSTSVTVSIPKGVEPSKVTVEVPSSTEAVVPNGATVRIVNGANDITSYLDVPNAVNGVVDLAAAKVKETIVREALDPEKGAEFKMNDKTPSLTTSETKPGLTYTLHEGATLQGMNPGDSKLGDGQPWTPKITIKGGSGGFYSIGVTK